MDHPRVVNSLGSSSANNHRRTGLRIMAGTAAHSTTICSQRCEVATAKATETSILTFCLLVFSSLHGWHLSINGERYSSLAPQSLVLSVCEVRTFEHRRQLIVRCGYRLYSSTYNTYWQVWCNFCAAIKLTGVGYTAGRQYVGVHLACVRS